MPKKQAKQPVSSSSENDSHSDSDSHSESESEHSEEESHSVTSKVVEKEEKTFTEQYTDALTTFQESLLQINKEFKALLVLNKKAFKESSRRKQKRKTNGEPRKPTGFLAPKPVPSKIRKYLGDIGSDEELSQNEISKRIHIKLKEDNRVEGSKIYITNKIAMKTFGVDKDYETSFIDIKKIISRIYNESVNA